MKKLVLMLFLFLSGCSEKPITFLCVTPLGGSQFTSLTPGVHIGPNSISIDDKDQKVTFSRVLCVEFKSK